MGFNVLGFRLDPIPLGRVIEGKQKGLFMNPYVVNSSAAQAVVWPILIVYEKYDSIFTFPIL